MQKRECPEVPDYLKHLLPFVRLPPYFVVNGERVYEKKLALQMFVIAAHLTPKDAEIWHKVALVALEVDDREQALYSFGRALKLAPADADHFHAAVADRPRDGSTDARPGAGDDGHVEGARTVGRPR